jgi:serine/threonine-protein kinase RsbW
MGVNELVTEVGFGLPDLGRVRRLVIGAARDAELSPERAEELAFAVNEVATNAILHGAPPATLRISKRRGEIVCEVADSGSGIHDGRAGEVKPAPDALGGRGLWLARHLCDRLRIRNGAGCTVSLHMFTSIAEPVLA